MGNIQAYVNYHTELSLTTDLNDQIQCCGSMMHPTFGPIQLWKIRQSNTIELFSFTRHLYYQDSTIAAIHQRRCSLSHTNLLKYYACTKSSPSFCGSVETQSLYFEYISSTLSQVLAARSEEFSEIEVWKVLEQLTDVLQYLQQNGSYHGKLCTENIFISNDKTLKILNNVDNQLTDFQLKQDVYDLGLVLVELMTKQKYHADIKKTVVSLSDKYTIQLLQLIARMLNKSVDKRPDFLEIYDAIITRFRRPTSKSPSRRLQGFGFTVQGINSPPHPCASSPQIIINQYAHQHRVSKCQISPKRVSPSRRATRQSPQRMPVRVSPIRVGIATKITNVTPLKKEINYMSCQELPRPYYHSNHSPTKINLNGSQASTDNNSHGVSFMDTINRTMMAGLTNRQTRQRPIHMHQHKSEVKKVLVKDDLNLTSSSQQND